MNLEPGEGGWAAAILTLVLGAAAGLNQWRKSNSNTSRQIQNDENATEWQSLLLQQVKEKDSRIDELTKRSEDHWMLLSEARFEIAEARSEGKLWKLKYEQMVDSIANEPKRINEHIEVLTAALASANSAIQSANEENDRLRRRGKESV